MADFRRHRAQYLALDDDHQAEHPLHEDRFGDVFLVIDGYTAFRGEFEELAEKVTALTAEGLSYSKPGTSDCTLFLRDAWGSEQSDVFGHDLQTQGALGGRAGDVRIAGGGQHH